MEKSILNNISYREISRIYGGVGNLLIDGDAFIDYIQADDGPLPIETLKILTDKFCKRLKNCGLKNLHFVFFDDYFTKSKILTRDDLNNVFLNQNCKFFQNCESNEWREYVACEQVSTIMSNVYLNAVEMDLNNNYQTVSVPNTYLCGIMLENKFPLSLLDNLKISTLNAFTFIVDYHILLNENVRDLTFLKFEDGDDDDNGEEQRYVEENHVIHDSINDDLNAVLENSGIKIMPTVNHQATDMNFEPFWMTKIELRDKSGNNNNLNSKYLIARDSQKYSRYMESYAQSLTSSKNLHYTIVREQAEKDHGKKIKVSKKELEIREKLEKEKEKKIEAADQQLIKKCEIEVSKVLKLVDKMWKIDKEIENSLNEGGHSKNFILELKQLKLKFAIEHHKYSGEDYSMKLCFLIKEIIESHHAQLDKDTFEAYLRDMNNYGFIETSYFLGEKYLQDSNDPHVIDIELFDREIYLQLKHNGDKLKRTLNSTVDKRVKFQPDEWQVKLLDVVDKNESALVCCPTSSGKTFICYYAMEKILRSQNTKDVIVFCSPTKALANQVAAEIYARFGDKYAMHMPDYKINELMERQIIITIPTMLETLICSEINKPWLSMVKYIIIDEVQTINDTEYASSMEKILHFTQCPILALSATIANFDAFFNWFESIENFKQKQKLHKISHKERYCDLQKFVFVPKEDANDGVKSLEPVHELFAYSESYIKTHDFPGDFHLLPTEIVGIIDALREITANDEATMVIVSSILPHNFFKTTLINKNDVKEYERFIMDKFKAWIESSVFTEEQLKRFYSMVNGKCEKAFEILTRKYGATLSTDQWSIDNIHELIKSLHDNEMLPVIIFTKTCKFSDVLAIKLTKTLQELEQQANSQKRKESIAMNEKKLKKMQKNIKRENISDDEMYELQEGLKSMQETSPEIDERFIFFNQKYKLSSKEIEDEIELHHHRPIDKIMFEAWKRGIGVHHANHHTKFRSSTECLFRKQHLQVIFATETLSLGINMPCKTVVMLNDALHFDTMLYRQMIGRAGRRGFDSIGSIVYYGLPENKVKSFISSDLIELKGQFTFNLVNMLQLSVLYFCKNENLQFLQSVLKNPVLKLSKNDDMIPNGELMKLQINYLIKTGYINQDFTPKRLASLVLPLRQLKCPAFMIGEFFRKEVYAGFLNYNENSNRKVFDENVNKMILALCYFIDPIVVNLATLSSLSDVVILPKLQEVDEFIEQHNASLDSYFNWAVKKQDNKSYFNEAFPYYENKPKKSYIYNYVINENLEIVEDVICVTTTRLWYALRDFKILLSTIIRYIGSNDGILYQILKGCDEKIMLKLKSFRT